MASRAPLDKPFAWPADESFRLLVEGVKDYAIFMLDPRGTILTWNAGAERIKLYRPAEIIGRHFSIFYPADDLARNKPEKELEAAATEGRFEDEGWRLRKDGTRFWANVIITALHDPSGRLVGFAKVTRDLTERKQSAELLRQSESGSRMLIDSIRDYAVFMLEPDGRVATWNPGAERIKGYRADEIVGKPFTVFYPAEDVRAGKCERELAEAAEVGRFEDEGWRIRKDGTRFWANVVISAVRDEAGRLVGFSKVSRDLTERKRAEDERAARVAAEQANQSKDEFLAMLGHELRNPLAPIVTALELIKMHGDGKLPKEHEVIERQVTHMVRLVDDLLDVSRITRGKIDLKIRRHDAADIVAKAVESVSPLLERRRHHLAVEASPEPAFIDGDEARLVQVFANLLNNAAKYTQPGGHITVAISPAAGAVEVTVRDDGAGMTADLLPRVFDLFVQGQQGVERSTGGLGIGLALVQRLVTAHHGAVRAVSAGLGQGSAFTVRLPASAPGAIALAAAPHDVQRPAPHQRLRVMVVDDNHDARDLIVEVLRRRGHEVRNAEDGAAALALLRDFKPDVAILDIGLPVMTGYELAARMRFDLGAASPRLIALTGYGQLTDRAQSLRAGFVTHLVKPIDVQTLLATVEGTLDATPSSTSMTSS